MMFILQKKNKLLILTIFLTLCGCRYFFPLEPIAPINEEFMANYGNSVKKAKARHQKSIKESGYDGTVNIENTAHGRQLRAEQQFMIDNTANNPYVVNEKATDKNVEYLTYNHGKYYTKDYTIFDDIEVPKNDFKHYNLGKKDYNEINNIKLQETYDYIEAVNKERMRQIEMARIMEGTTQEQDTKSPGLLDRTKSGLRNLADRVRGLLD